MSDFELSEIVIYPVKSCAGVSLPSVSLDRFGPSGDRRWLVVDARGDFLTQRRLPAMALLRARQDGAGLRLQCGDSGIDVPVPAAGSGRRAVQIWEEQVDADDAGDAAASWLSRQLGLDCRLVYMGDDVVRPVDRDYASSGETVGFADGFPLLLISQASLEDLNSRLGYEVPMNRFRPNLVVSGCDAFAEDSWRRIRIGDLEFEVAKPCSRCVIPSIDQATAGKDPAINRVLASYRRVDGKVYFGQNLLYRETGALHQGASVQGLA